MTTAVGVKHGSFAGVGSRPMLAAGDGLAAARRNIFARHASGWLGKMCGEGKGRECGRCGLVAAGKWG